MTASDAANTVASLFNVQTRDKVDAIAKLFFANGGPFHLAQYPYYKQNLAKIIRGKPSYVLSRDTKARTAILEKNNSKINILMEKINATWATSGCSIIMDGWMDIKRRPSSMLWSHVQNAPTSLRLLIVQALQGC